MADGRHFENRYIAISQWKNHQIFKKFCTQQPILNWMNVTWSKIKKLHWTDSEFDRTYFLFFYKTVRNVCLKVVMLRVTEASHLEDNVSLVCITETLKFLNLEMTVKDCPTLAQNWLIFNVPCVLGTGQGHQALALLLSYFNDLHAWFAAQCGGALQAAHCTYRMEWI